MGIKVVLPLEREKIESVLVKFPEKCVFCGEPKHQTIPEVIHREFHEQYSSGSLKSYKTEYDLNPINIPYCEKHYRKLKRIEDFTDKLFSIFLYASLAIAGILNIVFLFKPIYNWGVSDPNATFIPGMPPVIRFIFAIFVVLILTGLLALVFVYLLGGVYKILSNPPKGLKTSACQGPKNCTTDK